THEPLVRNGSLVLGGHSTSWRTSVFWPRRAHGGTPKRVHSKVQFKRGKHVSAIVHSVGLRLRARQPGGPRARGAGDVAHAVRVRHAASAGRGQPALFGYICLRRSENSVRL